MLGRHCLVPCPTARPSPCASHVHWAKAKPFWGEGFWVPPADALQPLNSESTSAYLDPPAPPRCKAEAPKLGVISIKISHPTPFPMEHCCRLEQQLEWAGMLTLSLCVLGLCPACFEIRPITATEKKNALDHNYSDPDIAQRTSTRAKIGELLALRAHCVHTAHAEARILTQEYLSSV